MAWIGFAGVLGLLLVRNGQVFSTAVYPRGDSAASAIAADQAKHFDLTAGGHSFVRAFGEWLFHDLLGLVPAPWNGQWLALLVLNAALVGAVLAVLRSWAGSWPPVALCAAVAIGYFATHQDLLSSTWTPYLYIAPFLLFLTAAASVAAGRTRHLWALALAGVLLADSLSYRSGTSLSYGGMTARYFLDFWAGQPVVAAIVAVALFAGVAALSRGRPFLVAGVAIAALATVLFVLYAALRIDDGYTGYFYWAVPLFLMLLAVLGLGGLRSRAVRFAVQLRTIRLPVGLRTLKQPRRLRNARFGALRLGPPATVVLLAGVLVLAGRSPALATAPENVPGLPRVVGTLSAYAGGRPLVVDLERDAWPVLTALVVEGDRTGQRVCARDSTWRPLVTGEFVCTARDVAEGRPVWLGTPPPGHTTLTEVDGVPISHA